MTDFAGLLQSLLDAQDQFILVGGVAATALIRVKRAAGRPKDFESIAELEAIREELQPPENS